MILSRLVLGTARIAGGAEEHGAVRLIRTALDAGITAIDTAPSYGVGTAEAAVGKAARGYPDVQIATKVGSAPPTFAWARTVLRRIKRSVAGNEPAYAHLPASAIAGQSGNDFSAEAMTASFERSLDRLGRIQGLLLHDISAVEVTRSVLASLEQLAADTGATPGYAGYAQWDIELDERFPRGMIAQCAPDPRWLLGAGQLPRHRGLRLHSIGKTGLALANMDLRFAEALGRASGSNSDRRTAELAALYALAAVRIPHARLLITSSHLHRLEPLLQAVARIDADGSHEEIAAGFPRQAG